MEATERLSAHNVLALTGLTPLQRQALDLHARGKSNREIAAKLSVSLSHVNSMLSACRRKLGVRGDAHSALCHWFWTQGPGHTTIVVAAVQDALRDQVKASNFIMGKYREMLDGNSN